MYAEGFAYEDTTSVRKVVDRIQNTPHHGM